MTHTLERLRHHVSGAIERGEAVPVVAVKGGNTWFVETEAGKWEGLSYQSARELFSAELKRACAAHFLTPEIGAELHAKAIAAHDLAEHKEQSIGPRNGAWFVKIDDATRV